MKKITVKKIIIIALKSIRVIAWIVSILAFCAGVVFFFGEITEEIGAGLQFLLAMIYKTLLGIGLFIVAGVAGCFSSKITELFKECGIK